MSTHYKIVTKVTGFGERYLLFKSTRVVKKLFRAPRFQDCWRYVPHHLSYVSAGTHRLWISEESCPVYMGSDSDLFGLENSWVMCSGIGEDERRLHDFCRRWPNIEDYLRDQQEKNQRYIERKGLKQRLIETAGDTHINPSPNSQ